MIAQHMDDQYIPSFVKRLNSVCALHVESVREGGVLLQNRVYVCSSICELLLQRSMLVGGKECSVDDYNPSIDSFFTSVSSFANKMDVLAIVLTGIGADGATGMRKIVDSGGKAIVESSKSAVVYGMPLRAKELTPQAKELSLDEIIDQILEFGRYV